MRLHHKVLLTSLVLWAVVSPSAESAVAPAPLHHCGEVNTQPYFYGPVQERPCDETGIRSYQPRHRGLAYTVLDLESEACFVPDSAYRELDDIIDAAMARVQAQHLRTDHASRATALELSRLTGEVLRDRHYGLQIPTRTLADMFVQRAAGQDGASHIFDCDTGSIILMTVAEQYNLPASLVEIDLPPDKFHNYVRWQTGPADFLDWDVNERAECVTPTRMPDWQARAMSREEVLAYIYELRAGTWDRLDLPRNALADHQRAMTLAPARPGAFNEFAWMIATRMLPNRQQYSDAALEAAQHAVAVARANAGAAVDRRANYLDTLACVEAFRGDFPAAAATEAEAEGLATTDSQRDSFHRRWEHLSTEIHPAQWDCTGE